MFVILHDWLLPTLRSLTMAAFAALIGYGIWRDYYSAAIMAGVVGFAAFTGWLIIPWLELHWPERVEIVTTKVDTEQMPELRDDMPDHIYVPVSANSTRVYRIPDWMDRFKLQMLVTGIRSGKPFTEAEWVGLGKPFSKAEFRQIRDWMLQTGMSRQRSDKDPRQGFDVTPEGERAFEAVAKELRR